MAAALVQQKDRGTIRLHRAAEHKRRDRDQSLATHRRLRDILSPTEYRLNQSRRCKVRRRVRDGD